MYLLSMMMMTNWLLAVTRAGLVYLYLNLDRNALYDDGSDKYLVKKEKKTF